MPRTGWYTVPVTCTMYMGRVAYLYTCAFEMQLFYHYFEEFSGNTSVTTCTCILNNHYDVGAESATFCLMPCTKTDKPLLLHKKPCHTLLSAMF